MATIWARNEEHAARIRAARPDADVQVAPPKHSGAKESPEARKARQARDAANKAAHEAGRAKPKPVVIAAGKPSLLHRVSGLRIPGGRYTVGAGLVAAGVGAGMGLGRGKKDEKATARRTAVGAGGAYGAYLAGGYALNTAARRAGRKDGVSTELLRQHRDSMGLPKQKMVHKLPPRQIEEFYRTLPAGVKYSGVRRVLARTHGATGRGRMAVPVLLSGVAGGAAYDNAVSKADRDYPNLPSWLKEMDIPSTRRNPINPLQMYASGLIMQDAKMGQGRRSAKARRRAGREEMQYTGARAMLYSPLGMGTLR